MTAPKKPAPSALHPSKLPWSFYIDGDDLVVRNVKATCFGGKYDTGDNGQTESGVPNNGRDPHLMGIALPIRSTEAATRNSPLAFKGPHIPWGTTVKVWRESAGESTAVEGQLIDNGPDVSRYPTHAIDLNDMMVLTHFSPHFDPKKVANEWGESGISYRIINAADYVD